MNKKILIVFIFMLMTSSIVQAIPESGNQNLIDDSNNEQKTNAFTHAVFAEECTATWCPNCPMAAEALHNIYESGDYPFYYVANVGDKNPIANERNFDYTGLVKVFAYPTVYFDGGDTNLVGRMTTVPATETKYRELIEQEGARTPKQPITMSSSVKWNGNAKLTVTVNIKNEGSSLYFGKIRSFVTEIVSRWLDDSGDPYSFAFLDYAVNKIVLLMPGKTKTITGSFDGTANHGGNTYPDITSDNIMVVSAIFNWIPHIRVGYDTEQYTQRYLAFFADQATAATPS